MADEMALADKPHRIGARRERLEHLDMVRGLAALAVCLGHARAMVFVDYAQDPHRHFWKLPLYLLTSSGGQAVMMFFALSGFLVGGPALRRIHQHRWDFPDYAVHRLTRLWTALIPALVATALLDWVGHDVLHLAGYSGEYFEMIAGGPRPGKAIDFGPIAFLGNVAFQMGVFVPSFGSNGALWSLAYEFAYYFAIPFAWFACRSRSRFGWRIAAGAIAIAVPLIYPRPVTGLGTIWVAGAMVYLIKDHVAALSRARFRTFATVAMLTFTASYPLTYFGNVGNAVFGIACAATLPFLAACANPGGIYGRASFWLSEISFTLYVVHFPLLLLLWLALLAPHQFPVEQGFAIWAALVSVVITYAVAMWWLFERNTARVRAWTLRLLEPWLKSPARHFRNEA